MDHLHKDWLTEALLAEHCRGAQTLAHALRRWIAAGRLPSGARLPSSRALAAELGIARGSVSAAYEQLVAEGYLAARHGSGTYVSAPVRPATPDAPPAAHPRGLSARGHALVQASRLPAGLTGAFAPGMPEIARFPHATWQRLLGQAQRQASLELFGYRQGGGHPLLCEALADYLTLSRGVRCDAAQILIVPGAQAALELTARLLAEPGDTAWVEEPGYGGAHAAFDAAALSMHPMPVDEHGLAPKGAAAAPAPRLIYLTPSHQYPGGMVMPVTRRLELLETAARHDAWLVEDDYDSEFRYSSAPIPALQGLDRQGRVIYVGTFSKVLYPALRLGYLVLPDALVDPFRRAAARLYREGHYPAQAALAHFIADGHFARHIRAMRELYRQRQALLRAVLARELGDALPLSAGEAGLHLIARLPDAFDEDALSRRAADEGLWLRTWQRHCLAPTDTRALVLGYAGVEEQALAHAATHLARLLQASDGFAGRR
ncbi:MocR-like pyridoxine biosynthesis transcription factor PdxR [Crenobacter intestini]|uniref:Putative 8-amino-7-oxononanoate synthase n=1 Tax=Crenobacter intestini TaxID=2563443 RepID=A0A4T0V0W9_9NEIS|nr:PLP-dependent aminotransferase family protein [Crenobacter intestini]TIC84776.1 PLP-dependent aminotransferase family protein [Crenobacter intestini]